MNIKVKHVLLISGISDPHSGRAETSVHTEADYVSVMKVLESKEQETDSAYQKAKEWHADKGYVALMYEELIHINKTMQKVAEWYIANLK